MFRRKQIQIIADTLAGHDPDVDPDLFDEPWRSIYWRLDPETIEERGPQVALWYALPNNDDAPTLCRILLQAMEPDAQFGTLLDMAADRKPVRWLWPSWIPRGMLSILGAAPGMGKSLLALDLARRILAGEPFPDEAPALEAESRVVYVDAEAVPALQEGDDGVRENDRTVRQSNSAQAHLAQRRGGDWILDAPFRRCMRLSGRRNRWTREIRGWK